MRDRTIKTIFEEKLIAIVRGIEADKCVKVTDALYEGGFKLVEITFDQKKPESWQTTAGAIRAVAEKYEGRMEVGAGTIVSVELVDLAASAGAKYMISLDANPAVIARTLELGLVSIPGVFSPTEIMAAHNAGADFVKLFPSSAMSMSYIKAVRSPISHVPMLAVGGVNENNLKSFLDVGAVGAGIGGNLVNKAWVEAGEYEKITELAKTMVAIAKG